MPEDDPESGKPESEESPFGYVLGNFEKESVSDAYGTTAEKKFAEKTKAVDSFSDFPFPSGEYRNVAAKPAKAWQKTGPKNPATAKEGRKSYKPIAPYPFAGDKRIPPPSTERPVQRLINPNPILIVKIEDEQLKITGEDNGKCQYYSDHQNCKKWNHTLNDMDDFTKRRMPNLDIRNEKAKETKLKCYKCFTCLFMTLSKESLNYHLEKKGKCYNDNETFHCPGCKNVFYSPTPFKIHLVHDHKMSQKEAKTLVENSTGIEVEPEASETGKEKERPCWATLETDVRVQEKGNKRPTMLETYLDEIGSKRDCHLPPPLNRNGSDLLENAFDFAAPHCEAQEVARSSPAMEPPQNHGYVEMANVFRDPRGDEYKVNEAHRFPDENDAVANYLSSHVDEIPVINLEGNNLDKCSEEVLPRETNADQFSYLDENSSPGPGPNPENDEEEEEEEEGGRGGGDDDDYEDEDEDDRRSDQGKKKSKRLGVGYRCDINGCKVRLQSEKNIRYHRRCHEGTLYNCPECCKDCSSWVSLSSHLWQAHKIDMELYKCDQCPYKTPSYSRLTNIHRGIHGKARPFLCDICGKGFKTVKQMRNHKNIHKAKMVRMSVCHCDICGRTVADKRQLELHINNTHKKKKPFLCYICGYASAVKHSLVVHMRRHTGEKPYKCEKCEYKTADHNALRRHKMKHTGARSYKCSHCNYTCIQASTYKVHIKTKHPGMEADVIFSCGQCNFQTLNRGSFLSHTSEHENYSGEIRKQTRNQPPKPAPVPVPRVHEYYGESDRMDFVGPIISERVVETIVDLSGAQSLLEDDYYEVERITGDLEEAQELKFKTSEIT